MKWRRARSKNDAFLLVWAWPRNGTLQPPGGAGSQAGTEHARVCIEGGRCNKPKTPATKGTAVSSHVLHRTGENQTDGQEGRGRTFNAGALASAAPAVLREDDIAGIAVEAAHYEDATAALRKSKASTQGPTRATRLGLTHRTPQVFSLSG